jgi:hypothetical protein
MKQKIVLLISLILLVGLTTSVFAIQKNMKIPGAVIQSEFSETTSHFQKGWNLIWGFPSPEWLSGAELTPENIKAIYGLYPGTKEYVRFYPDPELKKIKDSNYRWDTYIEMGAFWVYSDKAATSEEHWVMPPPPLEQTQLLAGWNFLGVTPEMKGKPFSEIMGNCDIERVLVFYNNNWEDLTNILKSNKFSHDEDYLIADHNSDIGKGIVFKVSSDCTLGESDGSSTTTPPGLPGSQNENTDFDFPQTIGEYHLENVESFEEICKPANQLSSKMELDIADVICIEETILTYYTKNEDGLNNESIFVTIAKLGEGKEKYTNRFNYILDSYYESSEGIYTIQYWNLVWMSKDFMIIIQEMTMDGSIRRFNPSKKAIDNPVTTWTVNNFPSSKI